MNDYYELMKMAEEEAGLLVGEQGYFNVANKYVIITLDEWFTDYFSTKYSVINICDIHYGRKVDKKEIGVYVPGIDDFNFHAWFYQSSEINLSTLEEKMFSWAARYNYRNINCHALEDYCRYLGAHYFDWN